MTTRLQAPSVKTLLYYLPLERDEAQFLRKLLVRWREAPSDRRDDAADAVLIQANTVLGGYGIEPLRDPEFRDSYYGDTVALYVNRGDAYEPTLLYNVRNENWWVGSWGDWYERYEHQHGSADLD